MKDAQLKKVISVYVETAVAFRFINTKLIFFQITTEQIEQLFRRITTRGDVWFRTSIDTADLVFS